MEFDTRGVDKIASENPLTEDNLPADFYDTFTAAKNMALAADNSNSRWNYINEEQAPVADQLIKADPVNAHMYKRY